MICSRRIQGVSWECYGYILGVCWAYSERNLVYSTCILNVFLGEFWVYNGMYYGCLVNVFWVFSECVFWVYSGCTLGGF